MEPFSIATGAVQVAGAGYQLAKTLYRYLDTVKNARKHIKIIAVEVRLTSSVLEHLGSLLQENDTEKLCSNNIIADAKAAFNGCEDAFRDVEDTFKLLVSRCDSAKNVSLTGRLIWPFQKGKLETLQANLERLKTTFLLMLSILGYAKDNESRATRSSAQIAIEELQIQNLIKARDDATERYENLVLDFSRLQTSPQTFKESERDSATKTLQGGVDPAVEYFKRPGGPRQVDTIQDKGRIFPIYDVSDERTLQSHLYACSSALSRLASTIKVASVELSMTERFESTGILMHYRGLQAAMYRLLAKSTEISRPRSPEQASVPSERGYRKQDHAVEQGTLGETVDDSCYLDSFVAEKENTLTANLGDDSLFDQCTQGEVVCALRSGPVQSSWRNIATSSKTSSENVAGHPSSYDVEKDSVGGIKYTRTGRISKATKGHRVHTCELCGKVYTRVRHLERHQQNHNPGVFSCIIAGCGRSFYREDLLVRHQQRHSDGNNRPSRPASPSTQNVIPLDPAPSQYLSSSLAHRLVAVCSETEPTMPTDKQSSITSERSNRVLGHIATRGSQITLSTNAAYLDFGDLCDPPWNPETPHSPRGYDSPTTGAYHPYGPYLQPSFDTERQSSEASHNKCDPYAGPKFRSPLSAGSSTYHLSSRSDQMADQRIQHGSFDILRLVNPEECDFMEDDDQLIPERRVPGSAVDGHIADPFDRFTLDDS